jgi:hypothetical protein
MWAEPTDVLSVTRKDCDECQMNNSHSVPAGYTTTSRETLDLTAYAPLVIYT